jgi:K+-transporting ATPase ATPase C chain
MDLMGGVFENSLKMFLWLSGITGLLYPLCITAIAQWAMPHKANGSLLVNQDREVIGSRLIAQKFTQDIYFWPRPSSVDYHPIPSGGSNWGPTSLDLKQAVAKRQTELMEAHYARREEVPIELLFASGSGLDPHISLRAASFQIDRIAEARGIEKSILVKLIQDHISPLFGTPYVNVLELNLAMDGYDRGRTDQP